MQKEVDEMKHCKWIPAGVGWVLAWSCAMQAAFGPEWTFAGVLDTYWEYPWVSWPVVAAYTAAATTLAASKKVRGWLGSYPPFKHKVHVISISPRKR